MNNVFADAIINLNIHQYEDPTSNTNDIADPVLRAIEKYKSHPSIKLIKTNSENNVSFRFQEIQAIEIEKELKNLDCSKASQDSDIPAKIIKDNNDIFVPVLLIEYNESLKLNRFPHSMKSANITPVFMIRMIELTNPTIGPLPYFRIYQKSLKDAFLNNYQHILMGYFLNNNVDLERVSMHNIVY